MPNHFSLTKNTDFMGTAPHSGDIDRVSCIDRCALRECIRPVLTFSTRTATVSTPPPPSSLLTYWTSVQPVKKNGHCDSLLTYPCPKRPDPCPEANFDIRVLNII